MRTADWILGIAALSLTLLQTAHAQQDRDQTGRTTTSARQQSVNRQSQQADRASGERGEAEQISASGQILRLKKVGIRNRGIEHSVAMIQTQRGRHGIVDLGPVKQLKDLKLQQGDRISVKGKAVRVGDRGVLMASHVESKGKRVQVDRSHEARSRVRSAVRQAELGDQSRERQSTREGRPETVRGKVEGARRLRVRHLDEEHVVAVVRLENGQTRLVDLGTVEKVRRIGLARGDTIVAAGDIVAVGDREVLMARRLQNQRRSQSGERSRSQDVDEQHRGKQAKESPTEDEKQRQENPRQERSNAGKNRADNSRATKDAKDNGDSNERDSNSPRS